MFGLVPAETRQNLPDNFIFIQPKLIVAKVWSETVMNKADIYYCTKRVQGFEIHGVICKKTFLEKNKETFFAFATLSD